MSKVFVIDPTVEPHTIWRTPGGLRVIDADPLGWADGKTVQMAVYGNEAMKPVLSSTGVPARGPDGRKAVLERWRVFYEPELSSWIAWVQRPKDDDRVRRERKYNHVELLIVGTIILIACVMAAIVLVVLPQCQGGLHAGLSG